MSERAREFLDQWLAGHVEPVPDIKRLRESVRLVAICREDAARAGILPAQLRLAAGGDLVRSVMGALGAAAQRADETVGTADAKADALAH